MKIRPVEGALFHSDRRIYGQTDSHDDANIGIFAMLRMHLKIVPSGGLFFYLPIK
jgi:hypothetical protein